MTVIVALTQGGQTWIGADEQATLSGGRKVFGVAKWHVGKAWALANAGEPRALQVAIRAGAADLDGDAHDVALAIRAALKADGFEGKPYESTGAQGFNAPWLFARPGEVWDSDSAFNLVRAPDGVMMARGSGMEYALGAAYACMCNGDPASRIVTLALEAASRNDTGCGGALMVRALEAGRRQE